MRAIVQHLVSAFEAAAARTAATMTLAVAACAALAPAPASASKESATRPTVVLVHGAFAESSSWNGVAARLLDQGYPVIAAANPLRSLKTDADHIASVVDSIQGPVVLVGHSYGGSVITNAAAGKTNVVALVYVAAFAPEVGETAFGLSALYPGSTLAPTLAPPVASIDGSKDLYIRQDKFRLQFAADIAPREARLMAATQRPITEAAGSEPSGTPAWKTIPSFFIFGSLDKNIPPAAQAFMAQRAGATKTVEVRGASHVVMTSHPAAVARLIGYAASTK